MIANLYKLKNIWYLLLGITIFRVIYLAINFRPLNLDEAQYWLWSQHLSLGYHSKPPLIAYIVFVTTHLFGNGYFGIRLIVPICYLLTAYFLYLSAKKLFSNEIAKWTALSFIFLPSVTFSSTIISTDPLMLMFWSLALYFFICAIKKPQLIYWILLGVAIGLSALSKYTGLVFLLSLFLYLLFCQDARAILKSAKLYIMLAVVILILLPNIIWNIEHGFATLKHIAYHNTDIHGLQFHPLNLLTFIASQLGVFSVIFFPVYVYCLWQKKYWQDKRLRLLWWFSLPMLSMILIEATISRAYANWAAAAYLSGTILVVATLVNKRAITWLKINLGYCIAAMLVLYSFDLGVMQQIIKFKNYPHFYKQLFGWEAAGEKIKLLQQKYPPANFLIYDREIWSKSVYFGHLPLAKVYSWNSKLDTITSINQVKHQDFIWLTYQKNVPTNTKEVFSNFVKLPTIYLNQFGRNFGKINVFYLTDFQGLNNE